MTDKRLRWLQKRSRRRKMSGWKPRNRRPTAKKQEITEFLQNLERQSKTIKVQREIYQLLPYLRSFLTPEEAAQRINRAAKKGRPLPAYRYEPGNTWHAPCVEPVFIGYYIRAEVTDTGELWVRYYDTNVRLIGVVEEEVPRWMDEERKRINKRCRRATL